MEYYKLLVSTANKADYEVDILVYELGQIGFESFEQTPQELAAYVPKTLFDSESLKSLLPEGNFELELLPDKDWNAEWEKHYFQPIVVGDKCRIRSSFHHTEGQFEYEILIDPKMSFGTGHHQTTRCMMRWILSDNFEQMSVLDMGCGTGVLGMLAALRGATPVLGVDIDEWCVSNARENVALNKVNMDIMLGTASALEGRQFDVVLANINRNILLSDMSAYVNTLSKGGRLYMSGFYTEDIPAIRQCAEDLGLKYVDCMEENNWVAVKFAK